MTPESTSGKPTTIPTEPSRWRKHVLRSALLFGIPTQALIIAAGSLILVAATVVSAGALMVNHMKDKLLSEAREQARVVGEEARKQIERVMADTKASRLEEVTSHPEVRTQLRLLSSEGGVALAAMIGPEGDVLLQQFGSEDIARRCPTGESRFTGYLPMADKPLTWEVTVSSLPRDARLESIPIHSASGEQIGSLEWGISESEALGRMEAISSTISTQLMVIVVLVVSFTAATIFLLIYAYQRHMALQARAEEAQHLAMIGTLASGLAHEIRNPLHAMNLHLEVAREDIDHPTPESAENTRQVLETVQRQIQSLNAIVSGFLGFAVPGRLDRERLAIGPLVGEVIALLRPEFDRRSVDVRVEVPTDAWIDGDRSALRQVLTNILLNAAQHLEGCERREVSVIVERSRTDWRLHIDDTGPGIPPGQEARIFDAFVSTRKGGTGFGLAIAKRIVEDHGGRLSGETRPVGGARFTVSLKAAVSESQPS